MSPSQWGPPIWALFHTMAEKIKEDKFPDLSGELIQFIIKISTTLPCPDCSKHATDFFSKIKISMIKTKQDLKNVLFIFHDSVNHRKSKPSFNYDLLTETYAKNNIFDVINNFMVVYRARVNTRLLTDSFQKKIVADEFRRWITTNISFFL